MPISNTSNITAAFSRKPQKTHPVFGVDSRGSPKVPKIDFFYYEKSGAFPEVHFWSEKLPKSHVSPGFTKNFLNFSSLWPKRSKKCVFPVSRDHFHNPGELSLPILQSFFSLFRSFSMTSNFQKRVFFPNRKVGPKSDFFIMKKVSIFFRHFLALFYYEEFSLFDHFLTPFLETRLELSWTPLGPPRINFWSTFWTPPGRPPRKWSDRANRAESGRIGPNRAESGRIGPNRAENGQKNGRKKLQTRVPWGA